MLNKLKFLTVLIFSLILAACVPISGRVWLDENGNGIQDEGEPGIADYLVQPSYADAVSTGPDGSYQSDPIFAFGQGESHTVRFPSQGYEFTLQNQGSDDIDSDADPGTGVTDPFNLSFFSPPQHLDAGLIPADVGNPNQSEGPALEVATGSISGFSWIDSNNNGLQDEDEPALPDVAVNLFDADGNLVADAASDADGLYSFEEVVAGQDYYLIFTPSTEYQITQMDAGDDALDSDADPESGQTDSLALEEDLDLDAGFYFQAAAAVCYGPLVSDFPEGISPLSGLLVSDPTVLTYRPVFLSISIFPPSVRPPTGLASSPIIYQLYIGDGDTRLMAGFYGEFPQPTFAGADGEGSPAPEEFDFVIGDRVWFDSNGNHLQDDGEPGVMDVPVSLLDSDFNVAQTTATDAAGNYYFGLNDVDPNTEFQIRFGAPPSIADYYWVNKDMSSDDTIDSDVTELGRTDFFDPTDFVNPVHLNIDAGLRQAVRIEGLRSGRVAYQDLQVNYCGCLVTAGADPTVAQQINTCGSAFGNDPNNIGGAGLDVTRLQGIASSNTAGACAEPNLSGNLFCSQVPEEFGGSGESGQELFVEYNINNISHFVYDAGLASYLWELSDPGTENFDVMTDRLTGETLTFENVVVLVVPHTSQNSANTIIDLSMASSRGPAYLFRNGQMFELEWSTQFPDYITDRDQPIPVHFELNGEPFPLAPGQTFINLLNVTGGVMSSLGSGIWRADFDAPSFAP